VKGVISRVSKDMQFCCKEIDITANEELFRRYKEDVPTVFINGKKIFKFKIDETEFRRILKKEIIRNTLLKRCSKKIKTV